MSEETPLSLRNRIDRGVSSDICKKKIKSIKVLFRKSKKTKGKIYGYGKGRKC